MKFLSIYYFNFTYYRMFTNGACTSERGWIILKLAKPFKPVRYSHFRMWLSQNLRFSLFPSTTGLFAILPGVSDIWHSAYLHWQVSTLQQVWRLSERHNLFIKWSFETKLSLEFRFIFQGLTILRNCFFVLFFYQQQVL